MPKPIKQAKRPRDVNQWARQMVDESTKEDAPSPIIPVEVIPLAQVPTAAQLSLYMAEMGRKGGQIGGKRRLETMTARQRQIAARKAALSRWKGHN